MKKTNEAYANFMKMISVKGKPMFKLLQSPDEMYI
jgi:hypothetical protein